MTQQAGHARFTRKAAGLGLLYILWYHVVLATVCETDTPALDSSNLYIVTKYDYSANTGWLTGMLDNKGRETRREYDALGRVTAVIENYDDGNSTADKDHTTQYAYDAKGRQARITGRWHVSPAIGGSMFPRRLWGHCGLVLPRSHLEHASKNLALSRQVRAEGFAPKRDSRL